MPWRIWIETQYWVSLLLVRFVSLPIALVIVLPLLVGAADEVHQSFLPGRVAGWGDWLADVVGVGLGGINFQRQSINATRGNPVF